MFSSLLGTKGQRRCFLPHLIQLGDENRRDSSCCPRLGPEPSLGAICDLESHLNLGKRESC